jgi:hypothetical protein
MVGLLLTGCIGLRWPPGGWNCMDQDCKRGVFSELDVSNAVSGYHHLWLSVTDMAGLSTFTLLVLHMANASELCVDNGQVDAASMAKWLFFARSASGTRRPSITWWWNALTRVQFGATSVTGSRYPDCIHGTGTQASHCMLGSVNCQVPYSRWNAKVQSLR